MYKPAVCWRTLEDAKVATVLAKYQNQKTLIA